jgi:predicted ester cyclase/ketosteroid isomerase-like protein
MKRIVFGVCIAILVFSVAARAQVSGQPGPEQKKLEVWAGTWTIQGEGKDGPLGPTYKFDWTLEGSWLQGGFFLVVHGSFKSPGGEDRWLEVLGYDPIKKTHIGYVFDYDGTSFTYTMTFSDRAIFEKGPQWRHEWNFSPDGMSVTGKGEREQDGKWWTSFEAKGVKSLARKEELDRAKTTEETESQNKKIAYLEIQKLWNEGSLDVADQVYAPNQILHFRGKSIPFGPDVAKETVSTWRKAFPDFKFQIEDIVAEGDKLAVRYIFSGTHQGEFDGLAPTGRKFIVSQMCIIRFENGKMLEAWEDYDELGMMRQLGMELRPTVPAHTQTESVEQELIRLEKEWAEAWLTSDTAFFERIEADDYMWTSPWGVWTKAKDLAALKSGETVIKSWVLDDMKVRVYGDTAVVTGRATIKEMHKGEDWSRQERWTDTWVKIAGRWQCVAGHSSEIVQKEGIVERT